VIWLVLRLHRTTLRLAAATTALVLAALAVYRLLSTNALIAIGVPQSCIADTSLGCRTVATAARMSPAGQDAIQGISMFWSYGHLALLALPLVLGLLTGAGIVGRELGRDAHLLTLTQNLGRTRWWAGRLALAVGVAVIGSVLAGAVGDWAFAPLDDLRPPQPLNTPQFETSGLVPAGQALFACALGAVLGLLIRSTAAAAFATTVVYVLVLFSLSSFAVRGAYLPPVTVIEDAYSGATLRGPPPGESDWQLEQVYIDAAGNPVPMSAMYAAEDCGDFYACLRGAGVVAARTDYHPASRYWPFQLIETAILLALAAGAVAVGSLRLRRSLVR
jgi:hypothetical protein